jgi:hypothetical protein
MLEMVVFVIGIYTIIIGKLTLPLNLALHGWRARVAALFLLAPLPLSILIGRVVGQGLPTGRAQSFFGLTELFLILLAVGGAIIFAYSTRPRVKKPKIDESH